MNLRALILPLAVLSLSACAHGSPPPRPMSLQEVPAEQLFLRAQELASLGEFIPAEQFLQAARAQGYPEEQATKELVKVCLASSRFESALDYAVPFLERNPDAWALRQVVATIYLATGEGVAARDELWELLEQHPEEPVPHYLMAVVLRDEFQDHNGARTYFEQYLGLAPNGPHAPEVRAWIRRSDRRRELATREVTP